MLTFQLSWRSAAYPPLRAFLAANFLSQIGLQCAREPWTPSTEQPASSSKHHPTMKGLKSEAQGRVDRVIESASKQAAENIRKLEILERRYKHIQEHPLKVELVSSTKPCVQIKRSVLCHALLFGRGLASSVLLPHAAAPLLPGTMADQVGKDCYHCGCLDLKLPAAAAAAAAAAVAAGMTVKAAPSS